MVIREVFDKCNEYLLTAVEDTGYNLKYIKGNNILKCGVDLFYSRKGTMVFVFRQLIFSGAQKKEKISIFAANATDKNHVGFS